MDGLMFQATRKTSSSRSFFGTLDLVFHTTVYNIRKSHRNALVGLLITIVQTSIMIGIFLLFFQFLGLQRQMRIHGADLLSFLMSGIFPFMMHTQTATSIARADGPTSSMMQHAPLTTFVTIGAAALGSLYRQMMSMLVLLLLTDVFWRPMKIEDPIGALAMLMVAWLSGVAVGIVFFSLRPWAPGLVALGSTIFTRLNMIMSGKMFVANLMPSYMLAAFAWNPLFHIIDQTRGYVFINYNPHFSSPTYALWVSLALIMVGLLIESRTRRYASLSWSAGR